MPVSTRDYQRERRNSRLAAGALVAITEGLDLFGSDHTSLTRTPLNDVHHSSNVAVELNAISKFDRQTTHNGFSKSKASLFGRYHWKMSHYFYIHLLAYILNGLFGGLLIFLIENYSSSRNPYMDVAYIDAWFTTVSTICSCGLTTIDFAQLSHASQLIMMGFAFISGFAISTLPALIIKAQTHKTTQGTNVDDDHDKYDPENDDECNMSHFQSDLNLPPHIRAELSRLPTPVQLRYRAYIMCIILILSLYFTIYTSGFIAIGTWLETHRSARYLMQNNATLSPWYISGMLTLFSFNQNGLTPFSTSLARYVDDVFLNIIFVLLVMSGSSFFPILLRNVVFLSRRLVPWRHKVIFDYILLNNHHLSTLLYPTLQTRIYCCVTLILYSMSIGISLLLDLSSKDLQQHSPGIRFIIFLFQTVNLRFCGFQTFDISFFTTATLLVYILLMATKPQMLCALDESPFEIYWLTLEAQAEVDAETNNNPTDRSGSIPMMLKRAMSITPTTSAEISVLKQMKGFLRRQSLVTKELARKEFSRTMDDERYSLKHSKRIKALRFRLFLIHFIRALFKHTFDFFVLTRTWLFVFIFLICAIEYRRMSPADPDITLLKIIFEIISAFGGVGMSLGYPDKTTSFASVLSSRSKIILIATMLMGRHRGLLASMKDQEVIEYSAANILARRREEYILQYHKSGTREGVVKEASDDFIAVHF
ncbi:unnamed protein product [Rotaria socialis]|uniref:Uncharacterized protein n=1 Tax=Rotaria socialis TaxID=392032 RepID=A0A818XT81_9BILA|nr:unnamed protein product [Rotaria socialis]CAF4465650.1 unnamed protein product [Rotaria socialis]